MQIHVSRQEAAREFPARPRGTGTRGAGTRGAEAGPHRVFRDVGAGCRESVPVPFRLPEHMVMGLGLETMRPEPGFKVAAQEAAGPELVRVRGHAHPDQMQVIGHEGVDGAKQIFPDGGVQCDLAKGLMQARVQPAGAPLGDGMGPENDGRAAIEFGCQTWQVTPGFRVKTGHGVDQPPDVGCYVPSPDSASE